MPVEFECCCNFAVDSLECTRAAHRAARFEAHQDDFVSKSLCRQGYSGSCDRKPIPIVIEVIVPRLSEVDAGVHERFDGAAQTSDTGWAQVQSPRALSGVTGGNCHGGKTNSARGSALGTYGPVETKKVLD